MAQEIRVGLGEFKGHHLLSFRIFTDPYEDHAQGRVPTKKGVTCRVDLLPDLIAALGEAQAVARAEGLLS